MTNIHAVITCGVIGLIIGFICGRYFKNCRVKTVYDYLSEIFKNLDNYVMAVSAMIVVVSIILSVTGNIEAFASITINIFGTIVFSWLLTKKSSKEEFKEHEQILAFYVHIDILIIWNLLLIQHIKHLKNLQRMKKSKKKINLC